MSTVPRRWLQLLGPRLWDQRFLGRGRYATQPKHAGGGARGEQLIVRRVSCELNDKTLQGTDEGEREDPRGWPGGDRSRSAPGADETRAALDETFRDSLEAMSNRVILATELKSQCDRDAGEVSAAVDGVTTCHDDQGDEWIWLLLDEPAYLLSPCLVNPIDHGQGEVLLVLELVIERPTGVSRLARHPLENEVAVAVAGQTSRGGLEQGAARTCAAVGLG